MFKSGPFLWLCCLAAVTLCHADSTPKTKCRTFSAQEVEGLFKECSNVEAERNEQEVELAKQGKVIKSNQRVADLCVLRQRNQDPVNRMKELKQLPFETVTNKLATKYKLSQAEIDDCLPAVQLQGENFERARDACRGVEFGGSCDRYTKFRTADGTCNNLANPSWGAAGTCFQRLLSPRYVGESGFRQSVSGGPLPEPRDLSLNVHGHLNRPTDYVTHMYMFFGQLLDHDITQAPFSSTVDNEAIECCGASGDPLHPQCAPIALRATDPFYSQFGTTCINFVRSAICPTCNLGPRQQTNTISAFIDASFVYGNSQNETSNLRTNDGTGRMRVLRTSVGDLMPSSPDPVNDQCSFVNTSDICFLAGDARANQHTSLASLHTIFLREHNRLADGLRRTNPAWNGERIFQEARRILGAMMQVITYKEYLPITLGSERTTYFDLWLGQRTARTAYDPTTNPTLFNEFSAAAFRFGHSLIGNIVTESPRTANNERRMLRDEFFQPFDLRTGLIDPLMAGVTATSAQWFDRHLVPDVTNFLYRIRGQPAGLDLASLNIQRGRDHGMPSYVDMVRYCSEGQLAINTFRDLVTQRVMTDANARLLTSNYRNVADVDLWTGILSEIPSDGAVVGPTGACVIGAQFHNLKFGDRFYFEHAYQAGSFTYQQVQQLKEMSLSKIICLNTNVRQLPLNAMLFNSRNNPFITCRLVVGVDLSYWRE